MATNKKPTITWHENAADVEHDRETVAWVAQKVEQLLQERDLGSIEHMTWLLRVSWFRQPTDSNPGEILVETSTIGGRP